MRKNLLAIGILLAAGTASAQVTTYVLQPAQLEGALEFTWADGWGLTPDLNDPAELITGFTAVYRDASEGDSLACEAAVNASELAGKIAVLYRGTCEFGLKALNAEQAGAIGVVIVNNAGAPVAMGAGVSGAEVTIPVVMISTDAGALLRPEIDAGTVEMLIGSVIGLYEYNLSMGPKQVNIPRYSAMPGPLAVADGFVMYMGSWIKNFGSMPQDNITLSAVILQNGVEVYNNTSDPASLTNTGDSAFFSLPIFSQASYSGLYEATYTINSPNEDELPGDNTFSFNYLADSLVAYSRIDPVTRTPISDNHVRATLDAPGFMACTYFRHPNASDYKVEGIYTSITKSGGVTIDGEVLEARVYEWNDVFTGWSDATTANILQLGEQTTDYFFTEDLSGVTVYIPLTIPLTMVNNQRYLFCAYSPSTDVFIGFGEALDYTRVQTELDQPIYMANDNGAWLSFANATHTSIGARVVSVLTNIEERERVEVSPFPNPTSNELMIPLVGVSGNATLEVFNLAGEKVEERRVNVGGDQVLRMDLGGLANGIYLFNMNFEDGKYSSFRVVVTK